MNNRSQFETPCAAYAAVIKDYRRNFDLYHGGSFVEGEVNAKRYLKQRPFERDDKYKRRVETAAYRNYAAPTVDMFASSIFNGVERDGLENVEVFEPLLANCNKSGDPPDKFFKDVATSAAAIGAHFVLVDRPPTPRSEDGAPLASMTFEARRRYRFFPYFVSIRAEDLISWRINPDDRQFDFVVFQALGTEFEDGPFSKEVEVKIITLWTRDAWRKFKSRDGGNFVEEENGTNDLGMVPVVPFFYEKHPVIENAGVSAIDDVAALLVRLYNMDSERGEYCSDCALPINTLSGITEEEAGSAYKASDALWCFKSAEARLEIKEPSGASYNSLQAEAQDILNSIREISLRQTRPRGAQVESAEAKRLDSVQLSSQLADFARNAAASERRCWEIAGRMAGVEESSLEALTIKYNEYFDPDALHEQLTSQFIKLRKDGDISRETVWERLGMTQEQIDAEKARIAEEKEEESRGLTGMEGSGGSLVSAILGRNAGQAGAE